MRRPKHLIIGSGRAALSALEQIRKFRPEDEIKLVTMENHLPYSPAALPYLLVGKIKERALWLRDAKYFDRMRATLVRGAEVVKVSPEQKQVVYRNGRTESYDRLLIATGAEPVKPLIGGLEQVAVHSLRTLAECRALQQALKDAKKVAILGAGLVGLKVGAVLLEKGFQVDIIEKEDAILPGYFDGEAGSYIRDIFCRCGGNILTGQRVAGVSRGKKKKGTIAVECVDGGSVEADVFISAVGVRSRIPAMDDAEAAWKSGILVDARMKTGLNGVYAAGDVAEAPCFFTGKPAVNAILPNAVVQGRLAGANMSGQDEVYEGGIPMTALHILGNAAFSIGMANVSGPSSDVVKEGDPAKRKFKKLVFEGDRLVGAAFVNEAIDPGIVLHLIRNRVDMAVFRQALIGKTAPLSDPWLASLRFG